MQSIIIGGLFKPVCDPKSTTIVQFNSSAAGELALFSYISTSSDKASHHQGLFILSMGTKNEELYNEPGSIVCCAHDLSQIVRFFNKELHIHVRSSAHVYTLYKIYSFMICSPKFASLITLTTGQAVLVVLGALSQKLPPDEVSKYFQECSHQDPLKIAASYTFLYVLNGDTGVQINSFLVPIKRKNSVVDLLYDTAGLLHIYYRTSQNILLKLVVKPLEFYNLQFTKDTVSLLNSRGECIRPLSPVVSQHTLRLEAMHASKMTVSGPLFGKLHSSSITLHVLCDYVHAKCIYHIYEEDPDSDNKACTLLKEVLSNSVLCISTTYNRLYYLNSCTSTLQILEFNDLVQHVLQTRQHLRRFTWTSDNTRFFKEFCASSSSPITLISTEEFELYLKMVELLRSDEELSLQLNTEVNETQHQKQDTVSSNQTVECCDSNPLENHTTIQDFSMLSSSLITELSEEPSDFGEPTIATTRDTNPSRASCSSFNELSARVLSLEETLQVQSADHHRLLKELEEFYDTMSNIADKQAKMSRKLDDFMKRQIGDVSMNAENKDRASPSVADINIYTPSQNQPQTLSENAKTLVVTLYNIAVSITGLAVKLVKQISSKLSTRKNVRR